MKDQIIYLDNAATSYPKPVSCLKRALEIYLDIGVSPGRGGYDKAVKAEQVVQSVRDRVADFFGAHKKSKVCFSANATDALNILIQGLIKKGSHVITTRLEHNSVLRPLNYFEFSKVIQVDKIGFDNKGFIDPSEIEAYIRPNTNLVIITHASNVVGTIQPVKEIGSICRKKGIPLILDTAQSAGCISIHMKEWGVSGLAFSGHKSLLGPTGIGGIVIDPYLDIAPTRFGGSGVDSLNPLQPKDFPYRLETGTLNLLGIIGLGESLEYIKKKMTAFHDKTMTLTQRLVAGLKNLPTNRIKLFACDSLENHLPVVTCLLHGINSTDAGAILDGDFGIAVRTGFHCAPLVHETFGTLDSGTIRFSPGPFSNINEIDKAIHAMEEMVGAVSKKIPNSPPKKMKNPVELDGSSR